jgi:hypothetical protein
LRHRQGMSVKYSKLHAWNQSRIAATDWTLFLGSQVNLEVSDEDVTRMSIKHKKSRVCTASWKELPWHSLYCCPGTLLERRKISFDLPKDPAKSLIINERLLFLSAAQVLGCMEYRLPPLKTTRYNKPTHNCCETTQISRQETGSPGPNGSRSPAVAPVL